MKNQIKKPLLTTITKPLWIIDEENTISYKVLKEFTDAFCRLPKPIKKRVFSIIGNIVILSSRFFFGFKLYFFTSISYQWKRKTQWKRS